jgi:hypothetical protein
VAGRRQLLCRRLQRDESQELTHSVFPSYAFSLVLLYDAATGKRLLSRSEEVALRRAAEEKAQREVEARRKAEAEVARLREELDRLRARS